MKKNIRLENRKQYADTVRYCRRLVAQGVPCGICHKPIDLTAPQTIEHDGRRVRAPWALDVDHITPLAKGGALGVENVQPSHHACNLRKGAGRVARAVAPVIEGTTSREW